jgi:mono/diheme cytochrome c family protein
VTRLVLGCTLLSGLLVLADPGFAAATSAAPASQIERGRYLTAVGDCIACHTPEGATPFSGGRAVSTPFGIVLSANLTPDRATGIGDYTPATFYRAMHEGVDRHGRHLYPAFPYDNFTHVVRADTDAIFAYLQTLPPIVHAVDRNQLHFPFNIRSLIGVWNLLFFKKGEFDSVAGQSAEWNRGAYLVQGLAHCGACHTPRNVLGGARHDKEFQGGAFGSWFAPDITPNPQTGVGAWSHDDLTRFLQSGLNERGSATGEMGEVVDFSTSHLTDEDLSAVLTYLGKQPASPAASVSSPAALVMRQGEAIWQDDCSACHRMRAQGEPGYFPPLKDDANLQQRNPATVVHYILAGARHRPTARAPTPLSMPAFDWKLNDAEVAAVATYARNSWGNASAEVTSADVREVRKKLVAEHATQNRKIVPAPSDLTHPGPSTLAPADTDSRDNGTTDAGRKAPVEQQIH